MSTLYKFGRCETPLGYIDLESYIGPEYIYATFYRTDKSNQPLTMAQIGVIIEAGIDNFESNDTITFNCLFAALMLLQAQLFQQKYEIADK